MLHQGAQDGELRLLRRCARGIDLGILAGRVLPVFVEIRRRLERPVEVAVERIGHGQVMRVVRVMAGAIERVGFHHAGLFGQA